MWLSLCIAIKFDEILVYARENWQNMGLFLFSSLFRQTIPLLNTSIRSERILTETWSGLEGGVTEIGNITLQRPLIFERRSRMYVANPSEMRHGIVWQVVFHETTFYKQYDMTISRGQSQPSELSCDGNVMIIDNKLNRTCFQCSNM